MKYYRKDVRRAVKKTVRDVSVEEVSDAFRDSKASGVDAHFLDSKYRALPRATWEIILEYSQLSNKTYKSQHYDCDNFAMSLCGEVATLFDVNGIGMVVDFSGGHAYNALLVSEGPDHLEIVCVEPQNDRWGVAQSDDMYNATRGYMIFC